MCLKMVLKLSAFSILIFGQTSTQESMMVSTTQSPSKKIEEQKLNCQAKLDQLSNRLEKIESTNVLELHSRLKILENENKNIIQRLEELSSTLKQALKKSSFRSSLPRNCLEFKQQDNNISTIYLISPGFAPNVVPVLCNMDSMGGGWTYILNRMGGEENFARYWADYKHGFGTLTGDFWLGLDNIHYLTGFEVNELLIELVDWEGLQVYAHYDYFSIGGETEGYMLKLINGYSGTAGDSFSDLKGMKFSTIDRDQDSDSGHCSKGYGGAGWWFKSCMWSLLTGRHLSKNLSEKDRGQGIHWQRFHNSYYSLKTARMMVRPKKNNK